MKKPVAFGILGLVCVVMSGVGPQVSAQTITKDRAKDVIEASDNYKPRKWAILLAKADVDACVTRGYLKWNTSGESGKVSTALSVTASGKQFFESASGGQVFGAQPAPLYAVVAVPIKPRIVDITTIGDGDNGTKIVEYEWNWDGKSQPQEVQDLILKNQPTNHGKVILKTDAGDWKVDKFE